MPSTHTRRLSLAVIALALTAAACSDPIGHLGDVLDGYDVPFGTPRDTTDPHDTGAMPADTTAPDTTPPVVAGGWIGQACVTTSDCGYDDARCVDDGASARTCTQPCDRLCPDRDGQPTTFCATATTGELDGQGQCIARCDTELYPDGGCRPGYRCRIVARHNEPETTVAACLPDRDPTGAPLTACLDELDALGIPWEPWAYQTERPDENPDLVCSVRDPIRVLSPINGVDYIYYNQSSPRRLAMSCDLALALHRLGDVLSDYDIDTVLDIGTFNCRGIAGSDKLSQHAHGLAIDIWGLVDRSGREYILEQHWEHGTDDPVTHEARVLHEIAHRMHDERIFNIVLTPNYNAGHDNHFHVDLTEGSNFLGLTTPGAPPGGAYYIGPNLSCEH